MIPFSCKYGNLSFTTSNPKCMLSTWLVWWAPGNILHTANHWPDLDLDCWDHHCLLHAGLQILNTDLSFVQAPSVVYWHSELGSIQHKISIKSNYIWYYIILLTKNINSSLKVDQRSSLKNGCFLCVSFQVWTEN